jgi:hypothetical protein
VSDYKGAVDYLIGAVKFNRGNTRRRYKSNTRLEQYDLSFVYTTVQLDSFQHWANRFGFDWFWMPLVTHYSGFTVDETPIPHRVRITSDLTITAITEKYFRVRFSIELDPTSIPTNVVVPSGNWIVANTPAAPSSPHWFVSDMPPAPSTGIILAGSPAQPAA